jgi:hypothetical protein
MCDNILKKVRSLDRFGTAVELTYKSEKTYKTTLGAITTLLLVLTMFAFGL